MNKNKSVRFAACVAFALAASATLPAAELTHRWSFNGDWSDSVGGADAVKCGKYVSLYGNRVHMGYGSCSHGTGYVNLGTNILDTAAVNAGCAISGPRSAKASILDSMLQRCRPMPRYSSRCGHQIARNATDGFGLRHREYKKEVLW